MYYYSDLHCPLLRVQDSHKMTSKERNCEELIQQSENFDFDHGTIDDDSPFGRLLDNYTDYAELIYILASNKRDKAFYERTGWKILKWCLETAPELFQEKVSTSETYDKSYPIHRAIDQKNHAFLDSLLNLSNQKNCSITDLLAQKDKAGRTSITAAITVSLPCSEEMVKQCCSETILLADNEKCTPLHVAVSLGDAGSQPESGSKQPAGDDKGKGAANQQNKAKVFEPLKIYQQIQEKAATMASAESQKFMISVLTAIDSFGKSPYQRRLQNSRTAATATYDQLLKAIKDDIIKYLGHDVSLVKRALYGTEGLEKELFLDMSDFSNPSHDFVGFIKDLIETAPPAENKNESIQFEDILFYVCLPDFNYFKEPPHNEIKKLFEWLRTRQVHTIKVLDIPDSTVHPMCDLLLEAAVFENFKVHKLTWRKLDINLKILTASRHASEIEDLTLYSSGNWSVLYHWVSEEGLVTLQRLQKVKIIMVQLHQSQDDDIRSRHLENCQIYKDNLTKKLEKLKEERHHFEFSVEIDGKWVVPENKNNQKNDLVIQNLVLDKHLNRCHNFLRELKNYQTNNQLRSSKRDQRSNLFLEMQKRFKKFTDPPSPNAGIDMDKRIKIAIIDNGADRIRTTVSNKIAKGVSYVTGVAENGHRILPWWMVADPHGTQMASLIAKANPFARLYIARVGKRRKDILPENAAKAIEWAIEQKVDIISISWVTKQDNPALKEAIRKAVDSDGRRPTLVFCSTADEGTYSGKVYPVDYEGVVKVAATDRYGHLPPTSAGGVNILVPGDEVPADGPSYMEKYASTTVSGSSVATACAAGIASLALLLLKICNNCLEKSRSSNESDFRPFYKRDGIMKIFDKMQGDQDQTGIQLSKLFVEEVEDSGDFGIGLYNTWQVAEFIKRGK
ncbi:hypothetical protein HDV64DRAFT_143531 [Trichoderma sp. TUCIM 5745]